jgi:hypothetical protein
MVQDRGVERLGGERQLPGVAMNIGVRRFEIGPNHFRLHGIRTKAAGRAAQVQHALVWPKLS